MRLGMIAMIIATFGLNFGIGGCTKTASEQLTVSPTMAERLKLIGKVNDIEAKYVSIKDINTGEIRRVRMDDQTKMDQLAIGDLVEAFVSDDGYASTIQRLIIIPSGCGVPFPSSTTNSFRDDCLLKRYTP